MRLNMQSVSDSLLEYSLEKLAAGKIKLAGPGVSEVDTQPQTESVA